MFSFHKKFFLPGIIVQINILMYILQTPEDMVMTVAQMHQYNTIKAQIFKSSSKTLDDRI